MTSASTVWTHGLWVPYCRARGRAPLLCRVLCPGCHRPRAGEVSCEGDTGGFPAGPAPKASEDVWPEASWIQYYAVGLSHPAECHVMSGWLRASWSALRVKVSFVRVVK